MGFLHKLWDETVAGPAPESGLSKLRKYNSFSAAAAAASAAANRSSYHDIHNNNVDEDVPISRCITILRSNSNNSASYLRNPTAGDVVSPVDSTPSSPSSPITPVSPFSPTTPRGNFKKLTRRKSTPEALQRAQPRTPTGYDWIVLSALDR